MGLLCAITSMKNESSQGKWCRGHDSIFHQSTFASFPAPALLGRNASRRARRLCATIHRYHLLTSVNFFDSPPSNLSLPKFIPFTTRDTTNPTIITSSITFETVPNEIVSRILAYTMASTSPLHLQQFLDLGRRTHDHDPTYDEYDVDYHFRSHLLSRDWWFAQLDPSQKDHFSIGYRLMALVNTSGLLGRPIFFRRRHSSSARLSFGIWKRRKSGSLLSQIQTGHYP